MFHSFSNVLRLSIILLLVGASNSSYGNKDESCNCYVGGETDQVKALLRAVSSGRFIDPYYNENGCWRKTRKEADKCTRSDWKKLKNTTRGDYIRERYKDLVKAHKLPYSPELLTCKAFKESCFRPQDQNPSSSAVGFSQVLKGTAKDLFNRGRWFKSKVSGFQDVKNGETFHNKMKSYPLAQLELGMAVLHQKSKDTGKKDVRTLLKNYLGSSKSANAEYAESIMNCSSCIGAGNPVTDKCLKKARASCY